ncbi:MAG TPA: HAD-IA family hydrolase [Candidatus Pristimantibacillus sp.]|nr:HAD-IA family hydrolase [Candidatus Pristimantibacillus sp.]
MANIIFDFDGTLADTFHIAVSGVRKLALNGRVPTDEEIEELRNLSALEVMKALHVSWLQVPKLVYFGRKEVTSKIAGVTTFKGMADTLRKLQDDGHRLFIISSNSTKNIKTFLDNNKLGEYFDGYWGDKGLFAKSAALKQIARKLHLDIKDCAYVGDEVRDIDAARKAGIRAISVTWGYNNRNALTRAKAGTIIDKPEDLLELFAARA